MKLVNGQDPTHYAKCLFFDLLKIVFNTNLKNSEPRLLRGTWGTDT